MVHHSRQWNVVSLIAPKDCCVLADKYVTDLVVDFQDWLFCNSVVLLEFALLPYQELLFVVYSCGTETRVNRRIDSESPTPRRRGKQWTDSAMS